MHSTKSSAARLTSLGRAVLVAAGLAVAGHAGAQRTSPPAGTGEAGGTPAGPGVTAFENVSVVPMDRERVLAGQTVVVRGDRIVALGPSAKVRVPAGAARVDGRGKYLIPGLADMHVHIGYPAGPPADDTTLEKTLFFYVANGVTTVRDMHSGRDPAEPGRGLALKRAVEAGTLVGPRIYTAGDPDKSSPAAAARTTAALKAAGYDFAKVSDAGGETLDSIAAAARRTGLRVVGHAPLRPDSGVLRALHLPYASDEHLEGYVEELLGLTGRWYAGEPTWDLHQADSLVDTAAWLKPGYRVDPARMRTLAAATRRAGMWNCPTLAFLDVIVHQGLKGVGRHRMLDVPQAAGLRRYLRQLSELNKQVVLGLHAGGAPLLSGTDQFAVIDAVDVPPGFLLQRELALFVEAGLTPYEALATSTRNVAVFLETADHAGTVAVGKQADLVLLGANPLKDIGAVTSLAGVMRGGQWFPRAAIDAKLDAWHTFGPTTGPPYDLGTVRKALWRTPAP